MEDEHIANIYTIMQNYCKEHNLEFHVFPYNTRNVSGYGFMFEKFFVSKKYPLGRGLDVHYDQNKNELHLHIWRSEHGMSPEYNHVTLTSKKELLKTLEEIMVPLDLEVANNLELKIHNLTNIVLKLVDVMDAAAQKLSANQR